MKRYLHIGFAFGLVVMTFAASAMAHPGHAIEVVPSDSGLHYGLQPEHGGWLAIAAVGSLCLAFRYLRSPKNAIRGA